MNRLHSWYQAQPRALRVLLTINVVLYVCWILFFGHFAPTAGFTRNHLALNPGLPGVLFQPWQLLTYNFLHLGGGLNGFLHILFNLLWLVWVGREYEELHGSHQLLGVYVWAGLGGGLLTVILHALMPDVSVFGGYVYGASAAVLGVAAMVATTYPYKRIGLFLLGPVRLVYLVIAVLVIDIVVMLSGNSTTAVGAHFGGALTGFLLAKGEQKGMDLTGWARLFFQDRSPSRPGASSSFLDRMEEWLSARSKSTDETAEHTDDEGGILRKRRTKRQDTDTPNTEAELDRILEKISAYGMESLTEEERQFLQEASQK